MDQALKDVRILDLTQYEAGTTCTQALAWLGADVIKVESPGRGDPGRYSTPRNSEKDSYYFIILNCNKRSITLNLKTERGKAIFFDLLKQSGRGRRKHGPRHPRATGPLLRRSLKDQPPSHPTRVKGFGTYGPYSHLKAFDMVAQATGGCYTNQWLPGWATPSHRGFLRGHRDRISRGAGDYRRPLPEGTDGVGGSPSK